ncbi:hypothetical protein ITP53_13755 [Nonomuraea sp. K274]|uniref:DUF4352 domain-containing protein n=1 Tax=Nonomuraea cypriaca TaxID=1187855 RepID=A0A931EYR5_9ACTN|nr:hypothetical protein [Nonomuraea cypriaca]MBF8186787.1 hypothetical protein [Nonomuraea cypriaca]
MTATEQRTTAVPSRRGSRRGDRRRGTGARVIGVVAGLLLLSGAVGVEAMNMTSGEISGPLTYVGDKGEEVDARRFTVRLDSFTTAKAVQFSSSETVQTDHLFLVVSTSAKSALKPYHLGQATLLTADGRKFTATDRVAASYTMSNVWVQPDIWVSGRYVFEVPAAVLPGARVVIGLPPQAGPQEPFQPEVEIDLGLDEAGARKLADSAQDVYSAVKK